MTENQDAMELQRRARRRLVGAIALVVLVVIVLPIIFDREPKPISQDLTIQIPSQDAGKFATRVLPSPDLKTEGKPSPGVEGKGDTPKLASDAEKAGVATARDAPAATAASGAAKAQTGGDSARTNPLLQGTSSATAGTDALAKPAAAKQADTRQADTKQAEPRQPEAKAVMAKTAASAGSDAAESFVIPLGLFRNPDNVKKVRGWVSSAGLKSFTESVPDANGVKGAGVKIMAGPFSSRDAAEKAREKLKARGVDVGAVASR